MSEFFLDVRLQDKRLQDKKILRFKIFCLSVFNLSVFNLIVLSPLFSQSFPPAPGNFGSTAIKKDSSIIISWAAGATVERGFMNISNTSSGLVSFGLATNATGPAEGNSSDVVSLGDSGVAVLTFDRAIQNESGPDFAIFENGFADNFIELAFVEVSSDGLNFHRFPSISEAPFATQLSSFEYTDCRYFNNLAGKYRQGYGTPFDLEEMANIVGLDIMNITHVKLIDVIGSIDPMIGSMDSQGNMINDLFPTEFASGGFDLDAVAVIHQAPLSLNEKEMEVSIYPNPTSGLLAVRVPNECSLRVINFTGKVLLSESITNSKTIDLSGFGSSCLFIEISNSDFRRIQKVTLY